MTFSQKIQTVSELNTSIKGLLETHYPFVSVSGEISNLIKPFSGHLYFTLKDEHARLKSVLFKNQQRYLSSLPRDGQHVICHGRISVYEPRGEYQLVVDHLEAIGTGALLQELEKLKRKLSGLGLFDQARKQPLPLVPDLVTLVTSPTGAAVHDFLKMADLRGSSISVEIFPVRVQGDEAAAEMRKALKALNRRAKSDIIVLCRGGGSIEDLQPFNDESLAMAVFESDIPVVSAIGHDIDYTIADFVADVRAATPTAAAEMILPDRQVLKNELNTSVQRITTALQGKIDTQRHQVSLLSSYLGDPVKALEFFMLRTDSAMAALLNSFNRITGGCRERLHYGISRLQECNPVNKIRNRQQQRMHLTVNLIDRMRRTLERRRNSLHRTVTLLEAVSPTAVLGRGYAIVQKTSPPSAQGNILRSTEQTSVGEKLKVLLHKGSLFCDVTEIEEETDKQN